MTVQVRCLWVSLLALWLAPAAWAKETPRGAVDGAGLFAKSPKAVEQANAQIEEIHRRYQVDVLIETVPSVPADRAGEFKKLGRTKFFILWADERALMAGASGVYILICLEPRHVEISMGDQINDLLSQSSRQSLHRSLHHKFDRHPDEGLIDAVQTIELRLNRAESAAKRGNWAWVVGVIAGIVGLWLIGVIIQRFRSGRAATPPAAVSSGALAGQSIYQTLASKPETEASDSKRNLTDAPTQPYPPPQGQ